MLDYLEYLTTWGIYLLAAIGLMTVWWRMTRPIPWPLPRQTLRVLVAATILVPAPVMYGSLDWAPALFVLLLDVTLVSETETETLRAIPFLLYGLILGLLVLLADGLFRHWQKKKTAF
ncbi:MAG: hypothetical protein CSH49_17355 [Alcanivorax sp.]|uniref:hypothetical protein n=1 Tax=unclassified Ketobacter TaxID=2639109 RepID=UPI000F10416C|nr:MULTISPECIES: hypothetical protein [unclassified Ketobacter]MCK5789423.1 hypothetical protein [Ketobacter sp.]RLT89979.1 MAG: hypothetical protein D9N13_10115 [Ketobacter sp. GenoA1]RLT98990.1 MAG: hypothetical protein D9N15_03415 [Ketobacter sp.]TNC85714.1 MAG: hypothetical protein CSH49_17355 [Alcanivorax sp.]